MSRIFFSISLILYFSIQCYSQSDSTVQSDEKIISKPDSRSSIMNVTIDAGVGNLPEYRNGIFIKSGLGFLFNAGKYYQLGPNLGFRYYKHKGEYSRFAISLDNRLFFSTKKIKPYLRFSGGYAFNVSNDRYSGICFSGAIGVWLGFSEKLPFYLEFGGDFDKLGDFRDLGALSICLGVAL